MILSIGVFEWHFNPCFYPMYFLWQFIQVFTTSTMATSWFSQNSRGGAIIVKIRKNGPLESANFHLFVFSIKKYIRINQKIIPEKKFFLKNRQVQKIPNFVRKFDFWPSSRPPKIFSCILCISTQKNLSFEPSFIS